MLLHEPNPCNIYIKLFFESSKISVKEYLLGSLALFFFSACLAVTQLKGRFPTFQNCHKWFFCPSKILALSFKIICGLMYHLTEW